MGDLFHRLVMIFPGEHHKPAERAYDALKQKYGEEGVRAAYNAGCTTPFLLEELFSRNDGDIEKVARELNLTQ